MRELFGFKMVIILQIFLLSGAFTRPVASVANQFYVTANAATNMLTVINAYKNTHLDSVESPEKSWVCGRYRDKASETVAL